MGGARPAPEPSSPARSRRRRSSVRSCVRSWGPATGPPTRTGGYAQVNVPSWADGGSPQHTGAFDVFQPVDDRSQLTDVWVDGELRASVPWQSATVFDIPDGTTEWRVLNTAVHESSNMPGSTKTITEWTFESTGTSDDYTEQTLPMIQAYYDVEADASGAVGSGRKAGKPVELGLELSHIENAVGMAELTDATLGMRVAGGDWRAWSSRRMSRPTSLRSAR